MSAKRNAEPRKLSSARTCGRASASVSFCLSGGETRTTPPDTDEGSNTGGRGWQPDGSGGRDVAGERRHCSGAKWPRSRSERATQNRNGRSNTEGKGTHPPGRASVRTGGRNGKRGVAIPCGKRCGTEVTFGTLRSSRRSVGPSGRRGSESKTTPRGPQGSLGVVSFTAQRTASFRYGLSLHVDAALRLR